MAQKIDAYQAEDGTLHETECAAVKRDLECIINGSDIAVNKPYAKIVATWLAENAEQLSGVLAHYARVCPKPSEEEAARNVVEGTQEEGTPRGPKNHDPLEFHGERCLARGTGVLNDCNCPLGEE